MMEGGETLTETEQLKRANALLDALGYYVKQLENGIGAVHDLMLHSSGVAGLRTDGIVTWGYLREGGRYESWLRDVDIAINTMDKKKDRL